MALLESSSVSLGTVAPDFSLPGVDGETYTLGSFAAAKALVVVFMCNHCPYVQAQWERLIALQEKYKDHHVKFVGINPNSNPDYPEDSFEKMKEYSARYGMNFPYLQDATQEVAKAYDAQCTPDIFVYGGVYDGEHKLAYHGRIDDNWKDGEQATSRELDAALKALVAGEKPVPAGEQKPSMGCSIKWLL